MPDNLPQHDAINRVYAAGIMRACTAGSPPNFCPNDPVLRAQQASQWDRALGLNGRPNAAVYVGRAAVTSAYRLPGPALSTVDSAGDVGRFTSITIGADGLPLISYRDETNFDLKVAHCSNLPCSSTMLATLDSSGNVGSYTSIAIGADGLGLISYLDGTNGDLKVAHCVNLACSASTRSVLDSTGSVGQYTSIIIAADTMPTVSYYDFTNGDLKVAHCESANSACSSATLATLDSAGLVGTYRSVAIGIDNRGLISYRDDTNTALKGAHRVDLACSSATLATLDSTGFVGARTAIAVGVDGLGLISYQDNVPNIDLKVAHCTDLACSSATPTTLDYVFDVGYFTSVTIGIDGLALVTYHDATSSDLRAAHCANLTCTHFARSSR